MLEFFRDAQLTRPVTDGSPIWILASKRGSVKRMSLWLADTRLDTTYTGETSLTVTPRGSVPVRLKRPEQPQYGIPNTPAIYPFSSAASADENGPVVIAVLDIEVRIPAGPAEELTSLKLVTNPLLSDVEGSLPEVVEVSFRIVRGDHGLPQRFRLFPADRIVDSKRPGFVWGDYRWRDEANAHSLTPALWDLDLDRIGREKFVAGIGDRNDLRPIGVEKSNHSLRARIRSGFYWTGTERYYLPSDDSAIATSQISEQGGSLFLGAAARRQKPVFVGALKVDHEGYYDAFVRYEYMHAGFDPKGPEYQFTLDRNRTTIRLNKGFALGRVFLGVAPNSDTALFDVPVHPIGAVTAVVMGASGIDPEAPVTSYTIDREAGSLRVSFADPEATAGRALYIDCSPAVMAISENEVLSPQDSLIADVDLNPAFAGIARGFLYLEHRKRRVSSIQLSCDKPRSYSLAGHENEVSYGPVFYGGDFALLQAAAFSEAGDSVPGARLRIVPSGLFEGLVNYSDPSQTPVVVTTGGDGIATFIYTPPSPFGVYVAPAGVADGLVTLPAPIPIEQLWNADEGWLARVSAVYNNDPVFGKVGANPELGEAPWRQTGTPGTPSYRTNGRRSPVMESGAPLLPVACYDAAGNAQDDPGFDGQVVQLSYAALPAGGAIGSYFVAYVGRIVLSAQAEEEGVLSNAILLDLQPPPDALDEFGVAGYLQLDIGRLNVNRLGGAPIVLTSVNTSRY